MSSTCCSSSLHICMWLISFNFKVTYQTRMNFEDQNSWLTCCLRKRCFKRNHQVRMQSWSCSNSLQTTKWRNSKSVVGSILYFQKRLDNIWLWDISIVFKFEVKKFFHKELISNPKRSWNNLYGDFFIWIRRWNFSHFDIV